MVDDPRGIELERSTRGRLDLTAIVRVVNEISREFDPGSAMYLPFWELLCTSARHSSSPEPQEIAIMTNLTPPCFLHKLNKMKGLLHIFGA
jgi:hypothetical protein